MRLYISWSFFSIDLLLMLILIFFSFAGQHIREFTEFLSKHPDTFRVMDECVVLVGTENMQDVPLSERLHLPQPTIDTKATQQLLDFFAQCIETKGVYRIKIIESRRNDMSEQYRVFSFTLLLFVRTTLVCFVNVVSIFFLIYIFVSIFVLWIWNDRTA